jgi:hypothetical protein
MAKKKRNFTRLLVEADYHCGHRVGLTPPEWWYNDQFAEGVNANVAKWQRALWNFRAEALKPLRPIDILVVNGDLIDGKGRRTGGSEQLQGDRNEQCKMAAACVDFVKAEKVGIIYGTPYHTGQEEDWEDVAASLIETPLAFISGQHFVEVNGRIFDFKHFIGGSSIPHGRATALNREKLWNLVWNSRNEQQPKADYLIRSHVHYYDEDYDGAMRCRGFITPCLQGHGSKFGVRICSGTVDIGMLVFDIYTDGKVEWEYIEAELPEQKAHVTSL